MVEPGPGSDFLQLDPAAAPARGRSPWLAARLREAITSGRLAAGTALPPTRVLAVDLGWARGVVVVAYERLAEEGLVTSRSRAGTRVTFTPAPPRSGASAPAPSATRRLAAKSAGATSRRLTDAVGAPAGALPTDLSPGVPDLTRFPRAAWLRAERQVLHTAPATVLRYGDPAGDPGLRRQLVAWLAAHRGIETTPDALVVVSGVAQALALTAHVLRRRGLHRIGVEDPGSRGARDELAYWGLAPVPVPVDAHGVRSDLLPVLMGPPGASGARGTGARGTGAQGTGAQGVRLDHAVVVTPAHQYPTGVALSAARRTELIGWAERHHGLVVEDDYDAEHRYDRSPTASLHPAAPERVLHTGSVSKTLAPGLRLGWLIAPSWLRDELLEAKHASDIASPVLPQLVLAQLLADGTYERHLRLSRRHQRRRRDALVTALAEALPTARTSGLQAGLHVVLELPGHALDDGALVELLDRRGLVADALGEHRVRPGPPGLVLGYASHPAERLQAAARVVAAAVRDLAAAPGAGAPPPHESEGPPARPL